jgi:transcriptional regulator with XRE-family HTH domain
MPPSKRVGASKNGAESIGQRLARMRKERGITQIELADKLGSTQSLVSKFERGELLLHGELIKKLAELYAVSADEILGVENKRARVTQPPAPIKDRRLLRRLVAVENLSKRDKEALLRTLDAFLRKGEAA